MPIQMLDERQIENNSKIIEELKASVAALKDSIEDYFAEKDGTSEENKKEIRTEFSQIFLSNLNRIRGVDVMTNLSIGQVILTKYDKSDKPTRWKISADI